MYSGYNLNKVDDLGPVEFSIFTSLDYKGNIDKDRLFGLCDYDDNHYISLSEFTHCYCYGPIHTGDDGDDGGDNGGGGDGGNNGGGGDGGDDKECTDKAIEYFTHYDISSEYALSKTEFAYFYAEYLYEEGKTVNQLFSIYDTDDDDNFSVEEFINLYCKEVDDGGDDGNPPVDTNCPSGKEFDFDIC